MKLLKNNVNGERLLELTDDKLRKDYGLRSVKARKAFINDVATVHGPAQRHTTESWHASAGDGMPELYRRRETCTVMGQRAPNVPPAGSPVYPSLPQTCVSPVGSPPNLSEPVPRGLPTPESPSSLPYRPLPATNSSQRSPTTPLWRKAARASYGYVPPPPSRILAIFLGACAIILLPPLFVALFSSWGRSPATSRGTHPEARAHLVPDHDYRKQDNCSNSSWATEMRMELDRLRKKVSDMENGVATRVDDAAPMAQREVLEKQMELQFEERFKERLQERLNEEQRQEPVRHAAKEAATPLGNAKFLPPFVLQDLLAREAAAARIANLEAQVVTLRRGQAATAQAWKEDATVSMAHSPYSGVNFLLGSAGARVAEVGFGTAVGNWREAADVVLYHHLGVALLGDATKNLPHMALDPVNEPGNCWCFRGAAANLTIAPIHPFRARSFFVTHIPTEYYEAVKVGTAAPRRMRVHLKDTKGHMRVAADFEYRLDQQASLGTQQHFEATDVEEVAMAVKLEILSNSKPASPHTCLYQFGGYGDGV